MKANELRIGNWVKSNVSGNVLRFTTYQFNDLNEILLCSPPKPKLEPILLNEEWLVKFGFEYDSASSLYHKGGFDVDFLEDRIEFYLGEYGSTYSIIEHVHQLQNLYFALTGEELQIK
jgi:hypothetical protein